MVVNQAKTGQNLAICHSIGYIIGTMEKAEIKARKQLFTNGWLWN